MKVEVTRMPRVGWSALAVAVFAAGLWVGIGSAGSGNSGSGAVDVGLKAALNARQEVPRPAGAGSDARGTFVGTLVRKGAGGTVAWRLTFRGLTGKATAAHVHLAATGKPGPVALPLCGPCRSGARGSAKASAKAVRALLGGGAYVNVHTAKNPAGEIRGQIRKGATAPQPPTTTTTTTTDPGEPPPYP
jgi:CHRD domain